MRISDWSSDVCSPDLAMPGLVEAVAGAGARAADEGCRLQAAVEGVGPGLLGAAQQPVAAAGRRHQAQAAVAADVVEPPQPHRGDTESGGEGQSVSVLVTLGGRRTINKKKNK